MPAFVITALAIGWYFYGLHGYEALWVAVGPPVDDPIAYRPIVVLLGLAAWMSGSWRFAAVMVAAVAAGLYSLGPGSGDLVAEQMAPDFTRGVMWVSIAAASGVVLDRVRAVIRRRLDRHAR